MRGKVIYPFDEDSHRKLSHHNRQRLCCNCLFRDMSCAVCSVKKAYVKPRECCDDWSLRHGGR